MTAVLRAFAGGAACTCEFDIECGVDGVRRCIAAGCACRCGGELECHGCAGCGVVVGDPWAEYVAHHIQATKQKPTARIHAHSQEKSTTP